MVEAQGCPSPVEANQWILKPAGRGGGRHGRGNLEGKALWGGGPEVGNPDWPTSKKLREKLVE
jgi:hypothetical protein